MSCYYLLTLNSLASIQVMAGGLKLETIFEVWAFNLCLVLKALFLVKDFNIFLSKVSPAAPCSTSEYLEGVKFGLSTVW